MALKATQISALRDLANFVEDHVEEVLVDANEYPETQEEVKSLLDAVEVVRTLIN